MANSNANRNRINQLLNIAVEIVTVLSMISQLPLFAAEISQPGRLILWNRHVGKSVGMTLAQARKFPHLYGHLQTIRIPSPLPTPITAQPVFHPGIQVQADQRLSAVSLLRWRRETSGRRNNGGPTGPVGQSRPGCKDALSWNIQPADGREPGRRPCPAHFQTS